jgi:hypothetical protein
MPLFYFTNNEYITRHDKANRHTPHHSICKKLGIETAENWYLHTRVYPKSFRTGRLERELQMVQLSATRCSCIAILLVSLVSFAAITLCVASQQVFSIAVYFVIDSVRKVFGYILVYKAVCKHEDITVLWNQGVKTDRF